MEELDNKIDSISTMTDHYLVKAKTKKDSYYDGFIATGEILKFVLSKKEFEYWCKEKMLLKPIAFKEKTFIQYAVETSVVGFFAEKYAESLKVEAKINPDNDKDIDCRFTHNNYTYNIEVKCSDFIAKEEIDNMDGYKYISVGRLSDKGQDIMDALSSALNEVQLKNCEKVKPHLRTKNMDNNLKGFLILANDKFNPTPNENEVNALLVGCDDENDMQNWVNYLYAEQGLFTESSFHDHSTYKNVDLVILTNLYYRHNKFWNKSVNKSHWSLANSFNLIRINPFRTIEKIAAIKNFVHILPNYSEAVDNYKVPGDAPSYVKDVAKIQWFVKDYLEEMNGTYLFQAK